MKILEMNEKSLKNQGDILTKLLIFHLLIALDYKTSNQSNAKTQSSNLMCRYEKNLLCIIMNFNENIRNKETSRKSQGVVLTKLLISHMLSALENQPLYHFNA